MLLNEPECGRKFDSGAEKPDTISSLIINGGSTSIGALVVNSVQMAGGTLARGSSGALYLQGNLTSNASAATATISAPIVANNGSHTISVADGAADIDLAITGNISNNTSITAALVKAGAGTLLLSGSNTYYHSGNATTVSAGTMLVNNTTGSATGTYPVQVNSGATFGGSGAVSGAITVSGGGILAPGDASDAPGILSMGSLTLSSGSNFNAVINSSTAGSGYDQANVTGTVSLNGANLNLTAARTNHHGDVLTLINNDGTDAVTGTFTGLSEGSRFVSGGAVYVISYHGGDGNDVTLTDDSPTPVISGAASVATGSTYTLNLSATDTSPHTISGWTIDWGDGNDPQTITGNPTSLTHMFSGHPDNPNIIATATDDTGTYNAASSVLITVNTSSAAKASATATTDGAINVKWAGDYGTVTGYQIERALGTGTPAVIATVASSDTVYKDTAVLPNTTYTYAVVGMHSVGTTLASDNSTATTAASDGSWQYVETVTVPFGGGVAHSLAPLLGNTHYQLRASGYVHIGGNLAQGDGSAYEGLGMSDAEWSFLDPNSTLPSVPPLDSSYWSDGIDYGTAINDTTATKLKQGYWGSYSADHTYAIDVVGQNATLSLNFHDDDYHDNTDTSHPLQVEIWQHVDVLTLSAVAAADNSHIELSWSQSPTGINGYTLERAALGGTFAPVADITDPAAVSFPDNSATPGVVYSYRLQPYTTTNGQRIPSDYSNIASAGLVTATLVNSGPINEGSAASVQFSAQAGSATYLYSYDFNNDGDFADPGEMLNVPDATASIPAGFLDDGPRTVSVHGRITGSDGQSLGLFTNLTVNNVSPSATITGAPASIVAGTPLHLGSQVSDPSVADQQAMRYSWTVSKDGSIYWLPYGTDQASPTLDFTPTDFGTYVVTLTPTDKDGGMGTPVSATIQVKPDVTPVHGWYFNDFESPNPAGTEWSSRNTDVTPAGNRHFLGQFSEQNVDLSLDQLPAHTAVTVSFDLYVILSWDGASEDYGPDWFALDVNGGPDIIRHTFLNGNGGYFGAPYGDPAPTMNRVLYPTEVNSLGYMYDVPRSAVYHFTYTLPDSSDHIDVHFKGHPDESITDESWGLDNVRVYDGSANAATSLTNNGPVAEGSSAATVGFDQPTGSGAYTYNYDFNNDGNFDLTDSTSPVASVPAQYLDDGPSQHTIHGQAIDQFGTVIDSSTVLSVTNVAPAPVITSVPDHVVAGDEVQLQSSVSDPSTADTAAGFVYLWSVSKDGQLYQLPPTVDSTQSTLDFSPDAGTYVITLAAWDKDGDWGVTTANMTVDAAPNPVSIITPATATLDAGGTTASLSVLGDDPAGESSLTYTWSVLGTPPADVTFSDNGDNSAKDTTVTFTGAGTYLFQVVISNSNGFSVTSQVPVDVTQVATAIAITPGTTLVPVSTTTQPSTKQFSGQILDQFGNPMAGTLVWGTIGGGQIDPSSGVYTAPTSGSTDTVTATAAGVTGNADVGLLGSENPVVTAQGISPGEIDVSWNSVPNAACYDVYRGTQPDFQPTDDSLVGSSLSSPSFSDFDVTPGTTYYYQVYVTISTTATVTYSLWGATNAAPGQLGSQDPMFQNLWAVGVNDTEILLNWKTLPIMVGSDTVIQETTDDVQQVPADQVKWFNVGYANRGETYYVVRGCGAGGSGFLQENTTYTFRVQQHGPQNAGTINSTTADASVRPPSIFTDLGQDMVVVCGALGWTTSGLLQGVTLHPENANGNGPILTGQSATDSVGMTWVELVNEGYNAYLTPDANSVDGGSFDKHGTAGSFHQFSDGEKAYSTLNIDGSGRLADEIQHEAGLGEVDLGLVGWSLGGLMEQQLSRYLRNNANTPNDLYLVYAATIDAMAGNDTPIFVSPAYAWNGFGANYYELNGFGKKDPFQHGDQLMTGADLSVFCPGVNHGSIGINLTVLTEVRTDLELFYGEIIG